jgi:uncharacterized protein (TIGR03503 family)
MSTRELTQTPILLRQTPIKVSVSPSKDETLPHRVLLAIDSSVVLPNTIVFQGKLTFPDRQIEPFSIMQSNGNERTVDVTNTEPGLYRVNVSAFGETIDGREFRLVVPEFTFNVEPIYAVLDNAENISAQDNPVNTIDNTVNKVSVNETLITAEQEKVEALSIQKKLKEEKNQETLVIIIAANLVIIVIALIVFFSLRRKNKAA